MPELFNAIGEWYVTSFLPAFNSFIDLLPIVVKQLNVGFLQTLKLFFVTLIGAIPLGFLVTCGSMTRVRFIRKITRTFVWIIRGTPLMLQILILFYGPGFVGLKGFWGRGEASRFWAASVAFIINYACYFSEIYRGGLQSIPHGQDEAGLVLGMTRSQIFFRVKLLQLIKRIIPPMSNEVITLVKDTSLARIISLQEIIWAGSDFATGVVIDKVRYVEVWPLFFTGVYYLLATGLLTLFFGWIERRLNYFK